MTPADTYEFFEHLILLVLLVAVVLYFIHSLIMYLIRRLKNKKDSAKHDTVLSDALLSLRLAVSLQADAQKFYDELIGGNKC